MHTVKVILDIITVILIIVLTADMLQSRTEIALFTKRTHKKFRKNSRKPTHPLG